MTEKTLRIAVAGLGTVGARTVQILQLDAKELSKRCGANLEVTHISSRDRAKDRGINTAACIWCEDPINEMTQKKDIDILVELIGGSNGIAYDLVKTALENGISVVTANKALMAIHGAELAAIADKNHVHLKFEAAVAGAIPVIKGIREGLAANQIHSIYGILNGTCNYILSEMASTGEDFPPILTKAQQAGYAEADPSFDIDGIDTAHKTALLTAIAFNIPPDFDHIPIRGIRDISQIDILYAEDLGYRIKLLGVSRATELGIEQSVEPCLIKTDTPMAAVEGSLNAIYTESNHAHETLMVGRGAGGSETASAVIADIMDIARDNYVPVFGCPTSALKKIKMAEMNKRRVSSYVRLMVEDTAGVFADIASVFKDLNISIKSALQLSEISAGTVPVILILHKTTTQDLHQALIEIEKLDAVKQKPFSMRIVADEHETSN